MGCVVILAMITGCLKKMPCNPTGAIFASSRKCARGRQKGVDVSSWMSKGERRGDYLLIAGAILARCARCMSGPEALLNSVCCAGSRPQRGSPDYGGLCSYSLTEARRLSIESLERRTVRCIKKAMI